MAIAPGEPRRRPDWSGIQNQDKHNNREKQKETRETLIGFRPSGVGTSETNVKVA
jgi:hypothetical protein